MVVERGMSDGYGGGAGGNGGELYLRDFKTLYTLFTNAVVKLAIYIAGSRDIDESLPIRP